MQLACDQVLPVVVSVPVVGFHPHADVPVFRDRGLKKGGSDGGLKEDGSDGVVEEEGGSGRTRGGVKNDGGRGRDRTRRYTFLMVKRWVLGWVGLG